MIEYVWKLILIINFKNKAKVTITSVGHIILKYKVNPRLNYKNEVLTNL